MCVCVFVRQVWLCVCMYIYIYRSMPTVRVYHSIFLFSQTCHGAGSQLQVGWHRILRLFSIFVNVLVPMGLRLVPFNKMVLIMNSMRILVRVVLICAFLEMISRFCATLSAVGTSILLVQQPEAYRHDILAQTIFTKTNIVGKW